MVLLGKPLKFVMLPGFLCYMMLQFILTCISNFFLAPILCTPLLLTKSHIYCFSFFFAQDCVDISADLIIKRCLVYGNLLYTWPSIERWIL